MKVEVGAAVTEWVLPAVSAEKMKTMALLLADPNPIHFDIAAVRSLGLGDQPVNQGPSNVGYVLNMLGAWAGGTDRVRALRVRFLGNVFGGDHVTCRGTVTAVRAHGGSVLADCAVELLAGARGAPEPRVVLSGTASVEISAPAVAAE
ncbi:MaoC family dehydratase [Nocardia flavorosea]|uniref:MaoC family dehydratase n=1 Tax=Nocardia flavorosea TaxID=53429 RepID=UPI00245516B5|nr:MaoC family dehydratase [Nocardia flavorosea]